MVRWTRLAKAMPLALVACTPFEAAPGGSAASSGGEPDAAAHDGGPSGDGSPDATTPVDYCAGAFLCDDFERSQLQGGRVPWQNGASGGGFLAIEPSPGRGGGLVARSGPSGGDATISTEQPVTSSGTSRVTVKLTYEILEDGCAGDGYTDLLQVVVKGTGYMNLNLGNDCELHVSFGCDGEGSCDEWVPHLIGGRTTGRVHELVFGARLSGGVAEGFYSLDGAGENSPIGLPSIGTNTPRLFVALGVDQAGGRTGVIGMRYEHVAVTFD